MYRDKVYIIVSLSPKGKLWVSNPFASTLNFAVLCDKAKMLSLEDSSLVEIHGLYLGSPMTTRLMYRWNCGRLVQ